MSAILRRRFRLLIGNGGVSFSISCSHLGFPANNLPFTVRFLSIYPKTHKERPFVVSYLIHSCGLSPQSAKSASKKVDFKTTDNPESVLCLLKHYGFTISHISKLVMSDACFLMADPEKTLLPKLEFLRSICVSSSCLPVLLCSNPTLLHHSLHNHLIPTYKTLRGVLGSDREVFQSLCRSAKHTTYMLQNVPVNVALLTKLKVSQKKISFLLIYSPNALCNDPNKFSDYVNMVIELGMDPSEKLFVRALQVISQMSRKTWEQKIELWKSLGFSEEQILLAFRRFPQFMTVSMKKITSTMDFVMNKLGYQTADIVRFPTIFGYSLEKRTVPRFSVIRILQMEGLVKANVSLSSVMVKTEKSFLDVFVINYEGQIPELLSIYSGKMSILELGCRFGAEKPIAS